jgi:peptidoglycan/xylan/chitin deacetylase (PgdA/CDA1 family)
VKSGLPKLPQLNKLLLIGFLALIILVVIFIIPSSPAKKSGFSKFGKIINVPVPTSSPIPSPTPSPTPKPLTFAEMNDLYGPCVKLPVLMYHHVQTDDAAIANKQTGLTTYTDFFEKQMQYLKDKGYKVASMNDLINFFDSGTVVPSKSVLITFDDGYTDFFTDAFPILNKFGYSATFFIPTGLMNNPGYLSWDQISSSKGSILFANHTWSHKNVGTSVSSMQYEILTADTQTSERGVNSPKVFAYPYGLDTNASETYLNSLEYKAAFTTVPGNILCKKQRFALPRIRIGSSTLSSYGF